MFEHKRTLHSVDRLMSLENSSGNRRTRSWVLILFFLVFQKLPTFETLYQLFKVTWCELKPPSLMSVGALFLMIVMSWKFKKKSALFCFPSIFSYFFGLCFQLMNLRKSYGYLLWQNLKMNVQGAELQSHATQVEEVRLTLLWTSESTTCLFIWFGRIAG